MPRLSRRLLLALTAMIALAGCQLDNITCRSGNTMCSDDKLLECRPNKDGLLDWIHTGRSCAETSCTEGETKCIQGNIYTCTADGKWGEKPTEKCGETGCSEGTLQPQNNPLKCYECGTDEAKCEGDKLITCSNRQKIATECEYGCVTAETNAYCHECKDDEKKCEKGFIVSCTKDGEKIGRWDDDHKQRCENGCFPGARGNDVSCYECNTDKLKCFRDDETKVTTIKRCLSHNWYDEEVCALGCVEGSEAKCKICNHGDKKFYNNEDGHCIAQECSDNQYQDVKTAEVSCKDDFSEFGDCLNGSSRCFDKGNGQGAFQYCENGAWKEFGIPCDPNNPCAVLGNNKCIGNYVGQICSDDGKSLIACPNNASCKSDFSGCASCQSGTGKCNGNKILKCINGEYQEIECQSGTHCEAQNGQIICIQHNCEEGQQRCQGNIIQKCDNYKWTNISACENGEQCKENNGKAACSCISGTSYCDDTTAKNCKDGQWQTTACGQNKSCAMIGDEAKCIECESGTKCKDKGNIMTCQNNAWSAATPCSDGMSCTGGAGNAKCVCTKGQAVCDSDKTKIKMCKADGTYGSAESCGTDMQCQGVAGSAVCTSDAMECSPGEKRCNGDDLQTCNSKGKWEKTQTCEKGCANMACNECNDGEYYVDEYVVENELSHEIAVNCIGHKWITTDCYPNLVENRDDLKKAICKGYCTVDGPIYCNVERYRCTNNNPFTNDPAYDHLEPIYYTDGSICECDDPSEKKDHYQTRCDPAEDREVFQWCNINGEWEDYQVCALCQNNVCYPDCTPGEKKCKGDIPQICNSKGKWDNGKTCEFGCNEMTGGCYPECAPGQKHCDKDTAYSCDEDGYYDSMACANNFPVCLNGECVECEPGDKQCISNKLLRVCLNSGVWADQKCGGGEYCIGEGENAKCSAEGD